MVRICLTALLAALAALPAAAAKEYTDIRVVVVDAEKGVPVARAAITLKFIAGKKMFIKKQRAEWDVKTDSRGQAEVPFIPAGKLRVQVLAKGYQTFGQDFEISGKEQTINVKLARPVSPYSAHETPADKKP